MAQAWLETFREVTTSAVALKDLHPLKLDRWHRGLVKLPDVVYMQLGSAALFHQVDLAAQALRAMIDLLGEDNLPTDAHEIARRHIKSFTWHVQGEHLVAFTAAWDKSSSSWRLTCGASHVGDVTKMVPDVETAVRKADEWLAELDERGWDTAEPSDPED